MCFWTVHGVSHVLMEPAKAAQPPIPVKKAKKQSHGIDIEPGPPSYANWGLRMIHFRLGSVRTFVYRRIAHP